MTNESPVFALFFESSCLDMYLYKTTLPALLTGWKLSETAGSGQLSSSRQ